MATLFESLVSDVYSLTNRPDLVSETELAVKAATLKAHHSDFYPRDLFETGLQFSIPAYTQSLEYKTLIPKWRALKYLRKDGGLVGVDDGDFFTIISPEQVLDSYKLPKQDIAYIAGTNLQIYSSTQVQYLLLGCYLNPNVVPDSFSSWVAEDYPYAIVYEAARVVFKTIGYDEQAATYEKLVLEQLILLKQNNLQAMGY